MAVQVLVWVPVLALVRNYPSFVQLSEDRSARRYAEDVLGQAPQGARILSNWHYATPLWYLQHVEKMRPDVEVVYVYLVLVVLLVVVVDLLEQSQGVTDWG